MNSVIHNAKNYAGIYARTSNKSNDAESSVEYQLSNSLEEAHNRGLMIYKEYHEQQTAKTLSPFERKECNKLINDAINGKFKTIIVTRLDRLIRNYDDWIKLKKVLSEHNLTLVSNSTIVYPKASPQDELLTELTLLLADREPDVIKERITNGRNAKRAAGICLDSNPSFGYVKKKLKIQMKNHKFVAIMKKNL